MVGRKRTLINMDNFVSYKRASYCSEWVLIIQAYQYFSPRAHVYTVATVALLHFLTCVGRGVSGIMKGADLIHIATLQSSSLLAEC